MKAYGIPKRKTTGYCGPHDARCYCDNISKKKERSDARLEIENEIRTRVDYDNSANHESQPRNNLDQLQFLALLGVRMD